MRLKLRVGTLMQEKNITERELAERAQVARGTVRALSRGMNTRLDIEVLDRIANALGVRSLDLLEE